MLELLELYHKCEEEKILFFHEGVISSEVLSKAYEELELKLQTINLEPKRKKRFYHIYVECLQNLYHHMYKEGTDGQGLILALLGKDESLSVHTGNYIEKELVIKLEAQIKAVNLLNHDELRVAYKKQLQDGSISEKGTAGLGLIDVARKSRTELKYKFVNTGTELSFFNLKISV